MGKPPESIVYEIDEARGLVRLAFVGRVVLDDVVAHMNGLLADERFRRGMDALIDLRGATLDAKSDDVWELGRFVESIQERRGPCLWAVIATDDTHFGMARMFQMIAGKLLIRTEVFRHETDAMEWLTREDAPA